jgi:hypothetical protein
VRQPCVGHEEGAGRRRDGQHRAKPPRHCGGERQRSEQGGEAGAGLDGHDVTDPQ